MRPQPALAGVPVKTQQVIFLRRDEYATFRCMACGREQRHEHDIEQGLTTQMPRLKDCACGHDTFLPEFYNCDELPELT